MCASRACAARQNFNVVRVFGFPVQKGFNLQTGPGVYNEWAFEGLDRVIAEAGNAGLRLIIALTNNWNYNTLQTDWKCAPHHKINSTCAHASVRMPEALPNIPAWGSSSCATAWHLSRPRAATWCQEPFTMQCWQCCMR